MNNDFLDQISGAGQSSYKTLQALGEINSKTIKKLAELNFTLATMGVELTMEQTKLLAGARNYNDLFTVGSGLAAEFGNRMMEINREMSGVLAETSEEFIEWVKGSFEAAGKAAKSPVAQAPAKANSKKTSSKKAA